MAKIPDDGVSPLLRDKPEVMSLVSVRISAICVACFNYRLLIFCTDMNRTNRCWAMNEMVSLSF